MILSFAGDNARYAAGRTTGLIPMYSNQTGDAPLGGTQFPQVYPHMPESDWNPQWNPTYGDIAQSLWDATLAGATTFSGFELTKTAAYISRVNDAFVENVWAIPKMDLTTGVADGFDDRLGGWEQRS